MADLPRLILCADDFALTPEVSAVIARLARRRCINAISCMAIMPGWPDDARLLERIDQVDCGEGLGHVQVGLHLTLSGERPLGPMACAGPDGRLPGPDRMLALALAGRLDRAEIAAEIDRQFAAFHLAMGRSPDFVDAHQHVHVYPRIRSLFIDAIRRHAPGAWVRVASDRLGAMLSRPFAGKALGSAVQAAGMRRALRRAGLACNDSFAGHYDFSGPYRRYLPAFLRYGSGHHVVMCHPGLGLAAGDGIARARIAEAEVIGEMPLGERIAMWGQSYPGGSVASHV